MVWGGITATKAREPGGACRHGGRTGAGWALSGPRGALLAAERERAPGIPEKTDFRTGGFLPVEIMHGSVSLLPGRERYLHLLRGARGERPVPGVRAEDSEARPSGRHHSLLKSPSPLTFAFKHVVVAFKDQENI